MIENIAIQTHYTSAYVLGSRNPQKRVIGYSVDCATEERLDRNALNFSSIANYEDLIYVYTFQHCFSFQERYKDNMWCYSFQCSKIDKEPV